MYLTANLDIFCECLRQHEPNEKHISSAEGQGDQSWSLVEDISCSSGADGIIGTHQRPHGEAQGEGDADHGLVMMKIKLEVF